MLDPSGPVRVEATRAAGTNRVYWTLEERRVRGAETPSLLGVTV